VHQLEVRILCRYEAAVYAIRCCTDEMPDGFLVAKINCFYVFKRLHRHLMFVSVAVAIPIIY